MFNRTLSFGMRAKGASPRSFWAEPHIVAIILVLAATVLRLVFLQGLGTGFVFITFYPAVMLAALYGGLRAGHAGHPAFGGRRRLLLDGAGGVPRS